MSMMRKFDYDRYFEQIRTMPEPIMMSELSKVKLDLRGIRDYAKNKGCDIQFDRGRKTAFYHEVEGGEPS